VSHPPQGLEGPVDHFARTFASEPGYEPDSTGVVIDWIPLQPHL
jgi:hypothetical protein